MSILETFKKLFIMRTPRPRPTTVDRQILSEVYEVYIILTSSAGTRTWRNAGSPSPAPSLRSAPGSSQRNVPYTPRLYSSWNCEKEIHISAKHNLNKSDDTNTRIHSTDIACQLDTLQVSFTRRAKCYTFERFIHFNFNFIVKALSRKILYRYWPTNNGLNPIRVKHDAISPQSTRIV